MLIIAKIMKISLTIKNDLQINLNFQLKIKIVYSLFLPYCTQHKCTKTENKKTNKQTKIIK